MDQSKEKFILLSVWLAHLPTGKAAVSANGVLRWCPRALRLPQFVGRGSLNSLIEAVQCPEINFFFRFARLLPCKLASVLMSLINSVGLLT